MDRAPEAGKKSKVLVICGPTATGKSALAVDLAKRFNGEVISADSRQVYRGLDIGSAKITAAEMEGVPHHLIDVTDLVDATCSPAEPVTPFTVHDFQQLGRAAIADIHARGKLPIVCGGTGMYIATLTDDTELPEVPPNPALRAELEKHSGEELFAQIKALDPNRAHSLDSRNTPRIIRAIEIATALGKVPRVSSFHEQSASRTSAYDILFIGLELPKDELLKRIEHRIDERIPALFEEIKNLLASGVFPSRLLKLGLEYTYGTEFVQGTLTLDAFKKILSTRTWQYVRRQLTWFKRDTRIRWFNPIIQQKEILSLVEKFLN